MDQSSSKIWKVFNKTVSMTRFCQPESTKLAPDAPIRVGLWSLALAQSLEGNDQDLPKADCNVAGAHAVVGRVFLDAVEMLHTSVSIVQGPL